MTPDACRRWRGALGAAAIGRLDDEAVALDAHLDACPSCRAELRDLRAVVGALAGADLDRLHDRPEPASDLGERVVGRVLAARLHARAGRRAHAGAIAAVVALVVLVAGGLAVLLGGGSDDRDVVVFTVAPVGVDAEVALSAEESGTAVELRASGLEDGRWYWLWLTGDDGERVGAGTFRGEPRGQRVAMAAAIDVSETRRIWVTDAEDTIVLDVELPAGS